MQKIREAGADLNSFWRKIRATAHLHNIAASPGSRLSDRRRDAQSQKLLEAKVAYTNVLNTATTTTDKALLSLTYVALARIYEFFNDNTIALQLYDKAIALEEMTGGAFREALAAKQRLLKPQ